MPRNLRATWKKPFQSRRQRSDRQAFQNQENLERNLHQTFQNGGDAFQAAVQAGAGNGFLRVGLMAE
jgi:hypothetical protein